jgi:DNA-binding NtrC family response regulator
MTAPFLTGDGHIRRLLDIEAEAIARALTLYRGCMAETARRLGIGRSTLYRKIDDLQLDRRGG